MYKEVHLHITFIGEQLEVTRMPIRVGVARSWCFHAVPPRADNKNEKERLPKTQIVRRSLDCALVPAGRASTSFSFRSPGPIGYSISGAPKLCYQGEFWCAFSVLHVCICYLTFYFYFFCREHLLI